MNKFEILNDIIPNPLGINNEFVQNNFSSDFYNLIMNITEENVSDFFLQYFSKSRNKRINNFIKTNIEYYGLEKVQFSEVVDNYLNQIVADNIPIIVNIESNEYTLHNISVKSICNLIENKYKLKWGKLYSTLGFEYNPIKPFSLDVNEQVSDTLTSNSTNTRKTDSETLQDYSIDKSYGYQAGDNEPTPKDRSESKYKDEGNDVTQNYYTRSNPKARQTNRNGNIGNIPQQELIKRERELWEYQIYNTMFRDLDKVLVIAVYGRCGKSY